MPFCRYILASLLGRSAIYVIGILVLSLGDAAQSLTEAELYTAIAAVTAVVLVAYFTRNHWAPDGWRRFAG